MKPAAINFCAILFISLLSMPAKADLAGDVQTILTNPLLHKARWSIKIVQLNPADGKSIPLLDSNAATPLAPASNLKVVTTSAALERLGPDFQFRTLLVQHGLDLFLIGDGDPTLGDAELLKKSGWDVTSTFKLWAQALAARKAGPFRSLQVDDSVFDSQYVNPNWPPDPTNKYYDALVAGINLNANCLDVYVKPRALGEPVDFFTDPPTSYVAIKNSCISGGDDRIWITRDPASDAFLLRGTAGQPNDVPVSVSISDPPIFAGHVLAETLSAAGIGVGPVTRNQTARAAYFASPGSPDWKLLAENKTSLETVISRANKDSMNLYAEATCKRLGFAAQGIGSRASGTAAVADFLHDLGVPSDQYHLDDGCGLSRENAVSANLMVAVLSHDFYGKNSKVFLDSLAIAGIDGTMKDRFRGTNLRGRVFAKSGFVNGVSCLSGYLQGRDQNWYAFSILFNDVPPGGTADAKVLEERIVRAIDLDASTR